MNVYYHDIFTFPLPEGHRFPVLKYRLLRQGLLAKGVIAEHNLHISAAASDEQLLLVHSQAYLDKVKFGRLSPKEIRRIGLPWSLELVERSRRSVGSTTAACRSALEDGVAVNLGGGTHHAFPEHGGGFCIFNDVAVAVKVMQRQGCAQHVLILDCDVHQGDGTAAIFKDDATVFTFSIHGASNYPYHKARSDLDIALPDGTQDDEYLAALERGLRQSLAQSQADLAIYLAGADPYAGDRLGRLAVSKAGLAGRDGLVFDLCQEAGLPVAVVMSGGYGVDIQDSVDIHFKTVEMAVQRIKSYRSQRGK
jgi:acetoin utilization deacetylase AcuC-like enzyme